MGWISRIVDRASCYVPPALGGRSGMETCQDRNGHQADIVRLSPEGSQAAEMMLLQSERLGGYDRRIEALLQQFGRIRTDDDLHTFFENADRLHDELAALPPEQKQPVNEYLRTRFYQLLRDQKTLLAAVVSAIAENDKVLMPKTAEEKTLLRSFTVTTMNAYLDAFYNKFIASKNYTWTRDSLARLDGTIPGNRLSCIGFVFEFLRAMYHSNNVRPMGRSNIINLTGKTAMNLPDMFAVSPHARQSFASRDALFGQIEADVNRDGRAYYITQVYDRRGRPLHSFAIFATRGADNNLQVVILESTPSQRDHNQPRLIGILDKLNSSPDYHRLDIVNIIPDNPGDQLRIVRHGATGYNLPVDQIMITGNSGQE